MRHSTKWQWKQKRYYYCYIVWYLGGRHCASRAKATKICLAVLRLPQVVDDAVSNSIFFSLCWERERGTCRVGSKCVGVIIASVNIFGPLTCPLMRSSCRCGMWVDVITVSVAVKCCQVYHSRPHAYKYIYEYLHFILRPCWEIYWLWKWAPLMNYEYCWILSNSKMLYILSMESKSRLKVQRNNFWYR